MAELKVKWYETRELALAVEREAIRSEEPVWNIRYAAPKFADLLESVPVEDFRLREDVALLFDDISAVEDPTKRIRLATEALEAVKEFNAEVAQLRQATAQELKGQGLTLARIGELAGPPDRPLHFSRIRQILQGGPTGRWAKAARDEATQAAAGE